MLANTPHPPRHPSHPHGDDPEEFEPGSLPVEPDKGEPPEPITDDPAQQHLIARQR